jgi:hypothetical protein
MGHTKPGHIGVGGGNHGTDHAAPDVDHAIITAG